MVGHLIKVGVAMLVVFSTCFLAGMNSVAGYAFFVFLIYIAFYMIKKFISDTKKTMIENHKFGKVIVITALAFLPYMALMGAGMYAASFVDGYLEVAVDYCHKKTADVVKYIQKTKEEERSYWWQPWTYFWREKISKIIEEPVVEKVSFYQKLIFALLYALLRCIQVAGFCALIFWGLSKFADLYVKAALRQGVTIKYRWCSNVN
jgi:hypothetical protein